MRTVEEFKAPFLTKDSAVYREGLRLVSLKTEIIPCESQEKLQKQGANGTCSRILVDAYVQGSCKIRFFSSIYLFILVYIYYFIACR